MGDISKDTNLIQNIKASSIDEIKPLEYIINRLDKIDDLISSSRKQTVTQIKDDGYPRILFFEFSYDAINRNYNDDKLISKLSFIKYKENNIEVDGLSIDEKNRSIIIPVLLSGPIFFRKYVIIL